MIPGKYRVWCVNKQEWEKSPVFLDPGGTLFHMLASGRLMRVKEETHLVSFSTDLKDKNRREIHGGDIQKWNGLTFIVRFRRCAFWADFIGVRPLPNGEDAPIGSELLMNVEYAKSTNIGNIYENPEMPEK